MPTINPKGLTPEALAERERCAAILAKAAGNYTGRQSLTGATAAIKRGWPAVETSIR